MKAWAPVDWVILILAVSIGLALLVVVIAPLVLGEAISDTRSKMLAHIATAAISVISVYVGARIRSKDRDD